MEEENHEAEVWPTMIAVVLEVGPVESVLTHKEELSWVELVI